jgi:hypothetical protein
MLGFTSPLFTLLCVFVKYFSPNVYTPDIVAYINIILLSFSAAFFYRVCRKFFSPKLSLFAVLIFAFNLSKTIPEGMETPLFILTFLVFFDSLSRQRYYISAIFLSLTLLARPDAGLIAVLAAIFWWQKTGFHKTVRLIMVCIAVALPWLIFSTIYFGSFIPQSLITKLHINDIVNQSQFQAIKVQSASLSRIYWGKILNPDSIPLQVAVNLLPFLFLVYLGVKKKMNSDNWILFAIPVLYFISFSISNPVMFPWYVSQMEPLWILISFAGLAFLFGKIKNAGLKALVILLIVAGPFYWWLGRVTTNSQGTKMPFFEIGNYIKEHMNPQDTVGVNSFGIIGYVSNAYIIDFVGIINYYASSFYPIKDDCTDKNELYIIPPDLIKYTKPNWLVVSEKNELISCFQESRWFKEHYFRVNIEDIGVSSVWKLKKQ